MVRARRDVLVLCYHALSPTWEAELSLPPDAFENQIRHLVKRGWRPTTFTEAVLAPPAGRTLAITFDDAFESVKRHALPVLADLRAPATVFAPTHFMSGLPSLSWSGIDQWQQGRAAPELTPMGWEDLRALAELGWEIGSHTRTHPHLTELDDAELARELVESREECERELRRECTSIAYPYGDVDERVVAATQSAGYRTAAALSRSLAMLGPYQYPRVGIYRDDVGRRFRLKTARPLRLLRAWQRLAGA
jgi:peptidoglycan/xylan/chitin deacetylase (PgdA/CDA1 family)